MKKYKIIQYLEKLMVSEYRISIKNLPKLIGKSHNTFWNYIHIRADSKRHLPHKVVKIEKFFKLQTGELIKCLWSRLTSMRSRIIAIGSSEFRFM